LSGAGRCQLSGAGRCQLSGSLWLSRRACAGAWLGVAAHMQVVVDLEARVQEAHKGAESAAVDSARSAV
jgi:hypothetical protein